jgi:hypothetical protein
MTKYYRNHNSTYAQFVRSYNRAIAQFALQQQEEEATQEQRPRRRGVRPSLALGGAAAVGLGGKVGYDALLNENGERGVLSDIPESASRLKNLTLGAGLEKLKRGYVSPESALGSANERYGAAGSSIRKAFLKPDDYVKPYDTFGSGITKGLTSEELNAKALAKKLAYDKVANGRVPEVFGGYNPSPSEASQVANDLGLNPSRWFGGGN